MNVELGKKGVKSSVTLSDAINLILLNSNKQKRNFEESIEIIMNCALGKDESLRGSVVLPNNIGKERVIIAFIPSDKTFQRDSAIKAGVDKVGYEDLVAEIKAGKIDTKALYMSSASYMSGLRDIASKLGGKGLMPNAKVGTLTDSIDGSADNMKKKVAFFKSGKTGMVQSRLGSVNMNAESINANVIAFIKYVLSQVKAINPKTVVKSLYIKSTMGEAVLVDNLDFI
jgi:large subunit ribosomal protein L1